MASSVIEKSPAHDVQTLRNEVMTPAGTSLADGTDLNDLVVMGAYQLNGVRTYNNMPPIKIYALFIFRASINMIIQVGFCPFTSSPTHVFMRMCTDATNKTWSAWRQWDSFQ